MKKVLIKNGKGIYMILLTLLVLLVNTFNAYSQLDMLKIREDASEKWCYFKTENNYKYYVSAGDTGTSSGISIKKTTMNGRLVSQYAEYCDSYNSYISLCDILNKQSTKSYIQYSEEFNESFAVYHSSERVTYVTSRRKNGMFSVIYEYRIQK